MLLGRYDRAFDFIRSDAGSTWAAGAGRRVYLRMGRLREAREELDRTTVKPVPSRLSRCLDGAPPAVQGAVSDRELTELLARPDPERLYFTASDLAYCGHTKPALRLLDEAVRRNYCAYPAAETDPTFASVRGTAEFAQILQAGRACRERFEAHAGAHQR
jgi:hypothetical protein